ncbi:MAG: hypothetical protein KGO02_02335 [Alphaproteobacteria bacterium]|nr:hypothetical protein [Alphaproteobacteria bacterium]
MCGRDRTVHVFLVVNLTAKRLEGVRCAGEVVQLIKEPDCNEFKWIAVSIQAVAIAIEPVLAAPGAEHHLRMLDEILVDGISASSTPMASVESHSGAA